MIQGTGDFELPLLMTVAIFGRGSLHHSASPQGQVSCLRADNALPTVVQPTEMRNTRHTPCWNRANTCTELFRICCKHWQIRLDSKFKAMWAWGLSFSG